MTATAIPIRPEVVPAAPLARHRRWAPVLLHVAVFVAIVVAPVVLTGWYLVFRAAPQFVSRASFTIGAEQNPFAVNGLGGWPR